MLNSDVEVSTLMKQVETDKEAMATWSDDRRREFVHTFHQRVEAGRFILEATAENVLEKAVARKYLSEKHMADVWGKPTGWSSNRSRGPIYNRTGGQKDPNFLIGGRSHEELIGLARERASKILDELPPIKNAVKIISPETAEMMDKRDKLLKKADELKTKLMELSEQLKLSDYDDMVIKDFRALVNKREKERKATLEKANEIGKEGCDLEDEINKRLYSGLPGITDAILKVAKNLEERSKAMEQFSRRIHELVMFGDSKSAMEVLSQFEKDEVNISEDVKSGFDDALKKLKLAAASGKIPKELAGGKK